MKMITDNKSLTQVVGLHSYLTNYFTFANILLDFVSSYQCSDLKIFCLLNMHDYFFFASNPLGRWATCYKNVRNVL